MGRGLDAHQDPDLALDPADVGLEDVEVGLALVVAGVEVHVGEPGLLAGRADDLHDLVHGLVVRVVDAEVEAHRAELAVRLLGLLRPVLADLGRVDAEVRALERADARHGLAGRRLLVVPGRARRELEGRDRLVAEVEDVGAVLPVEHVGRLLRELLRDRDVRPQAAGQDDLEPAAEPRARAEDLAAPVLLDEAAVVDAHALAVEVQLQQGRVAANVQVHRVSSRPSSIAGGHDGGHRGRLVVRRPGRAGTATTVQRDACRVRLRSPARPSRMRAPLPRMPKPGSRKARRVRGDPTGLVGPAGRPTSAAG